MPKNWGTARIEVNNLRGEILRGLNSECTLASLYKKMQATHGIKATYDGFRKNVRKIGKPPNIRAHSSWGDARAEVMALRSQIRTSLTDGRTLKSIYDELKAERRVSGSYKGFYKNVKKFCVQAGFPRSPAVQQSPPPPESNSAPPRAVSPAPPSPGPLPCTVSTDAVAAIPTAGSAPQPALGKGFGEKVSAGRRPGRVPVFDRTPETEEEIYGCPKLK